MIVCRSICLVEKRKEKAKDCKTITPIAIIINYKQAKNSIVSAVKITPT